MGAGRARDSTAREPSDSNPQRKNGKMTANTPIVDPLPRTQSETVERIRELGSAGLDHAGIERSRLLEALDYTHALEFLRPDVEHSAKTWVRQYATTRDVESEARGYLEHAWRKANGNRGTSILRALAHFRGLAWLIGADKLYATLDLAGNPNAFTYYGKPHLVAVSEHFGFEWQSADNDQWIRAVGDEPLTAAAALAEVSV